MLHKTKIPQPPTRKARGQTGDGDGQERKPAGVKEELSGAYACLRMCAHTHVCSGSHVPSGYDPRFWNQTCVQTPALSLNRCGPLSKHFTSRPLSPHL